MRVRAVAGRFYPALLQARPKPTAITTAAAPWAPSQDSVCGIGLIITVRSEARVTDGKCEKSTDLWYYGKAVLIYGNQCWFMEKTR